MMTGIYTHRWQGSEIAEVKSGKATFTCAGEELELYLNDFKDFMGIANMLDAVIEQTYHETKNTAIKNVERLFK
jgi:hypothetical protein